MSYIGKFLGSRSKVAILLSTVCINDKDVYHVTVNAEARSGTGIYLLGDLHRSQISQITSVKILILTIVPLSALWVAFLYY